MRVAAIIAAAGLVAFCALLAVGRLAGPAVELMVALPASWWVSGMTVRELTRRRSR